MTSLQGFTDGSYDYSHMYDIPDLHGSFPRFKFNKGSLLEFLHCHTKCKGFSALIEKTQLAGYYNDPQSTFTLFVPLSMTECDAKNIDSYNAQQLLLLHSLDFKASYTFLISSHVMYVNTRVSGEKILIENLNTGTPTLNRCSRILGQQEVGKSMVYFIDKPLPLKNGNPMAHVSI